MAGLSVYKTRTTAHPTPNPEVGRRHLLPLLSALDTLEAELVAESEREECGKEKRGGDGENENEDGQQRGGSEEEYDDEEEDDGDQWEDARLPYMHRVSFLMCVKALQADCARSTGQADLALQSAIVFLQIAKRNAHYIQYMNCGMQPMITIVVGTIVITIY